MTQLTKQVRLLVTDLDNTLFDWVLIWFESFSAMLDEIVRISGVDRQILVREIREIHQRHGTSEYSFLIEEIPSLKEKYRSSTLTEIFDPAIHAYRRKRKEYLNLYPTVRETLCELRERGTIIVGYTESMAYYTSYRVKHLGLDGLLDFLYSPPDHDVPRNIPAERLRFYPASYYDLEKTQHRATPKGRLKPDAEILKNIIREMGVSATETLYVGDSIMKDIAMAEDAGVANAHAAYGVAQRRPEYELLRAVTHWTDEDVRREREITQRNVTPKLVLSNHFGELLEYFDFASGRK